MNEDHVLKWLSASLGPAVAMLALVVAAAQWRIAKRQHDTAQEKLRLDMFDRRFASFQKLIRAVDAGLRPGAQATTEFVVWGELGSESGFLFGKDVKAVVNDLYSTISRIHELGGPQVAAENSKVERLVMRVGETLMSLDEVFAPYLAFARVKDDVAGH